MLPQLARYLFQFHHVCIPSVGNIRLVQQPALLDVASKIIHPPSFGLQFSEAGSVSPHQLWHFGTQLHFDEPATRNALQSAGDQLRKAIEHAPFTWNGIGTFSYNDAHLSFEPQAVPSLLQPVAAERVTREGAQHTVLVGDQFVLSNNRREETELDEKQRNWRQLAGWAAVILSLLFVLFYLYQHQFHPLASGLQQHVDVIATPATYN